MDLPIMSKEQWREATRHLRPAQTDAEFDAAWDKFVHLKYDLCDDEGCPHHGTLHVCNPGE